VGGSLLSTVSDFTTSRGAVEGLSPFSMCNVVTAEDFELSVLLDLAAERQCHVVAFDRPGFGYSDRPRGAMWPPARQADLLRQAFARLGIERPIIVGHSWGTLVALALALDHPTR
jgi:pimeloyl-ACP methyl ester carboxylesterase